MMSEAGGMQRHNTMQQFFKIELENDDLREELHEVQSTFTVTDQKLLEIQQEKVYAETEYDNYRGEAQDDIHNLIDELKDKELELERLRNKVQDKEYSMAMDDSEQQRLQRQLDEMESKIKNQKDNN